MAEPPEPEPTPEPPADPAATSVALASLAALLLAGAVAELVKAGLAEYPPERLAALDSPGHEAQKAAHTDFIARGNALMAGARDILAAAREFQAARPVPPSLSPSDN
jgi:hypothetical protein